MLKMRWLVLGLLTAWAAGFTAAAMADDFGMAPPPDSGMMLAMDGAGDDGGNSGPGGAPGAPGMEGDEGGPGHGPGMGGRHGGPLAGLNLTQEQKDKLKALRRSRRDKIQAIQNSLQDAREDLHDLLRSDGKGDDFNAKARAQNEKVLDLAKKLGQERFESILEIRSILTPEQIKKFDQQRPGLWRRGRQGRQGQGPAAGQNKPDADPES
jgi:protein CpxP